MLAVLVANQIERQTPRMLDRDSMFGIAAAFIKKTHQNLENKTIPDENDEF